MDRKVLEKALFSEMANVFAVLDGASIKDLRMRLYEMRPPYHCLFRGELEPDMEEVAPYMVGLIAGTPFTEWVLNEHFGKHWGIFARTRQSIIEMRKHFRSLVTVYNEAGDPKIFRYYDPRVFRSFLPTCNGGELKEFFGSVSEYFAEVPGGDSMTMYKLDNGKLIEKDLE